MKKSIIKTIIFLGFAVFVLGIILDPIMKPSSSATTFVISGLTYIGIGAILGTVFIFSKNSTLANAGYGLCAVVGAIGVVMVLNSDAFYLTIIPVGLVIMFVGALLQFLLVAIQFFGFFKSGDKQVVGDISDTLTKYKELQKEKVISEEEFNDLKNKVIATNSADTVSLEDLKKWKKLLDQEIITEAEFANMKAKIFTK